VVGGVKCDAYEQRHDRQEKDAGENFHGLQFTYLIDATLNLPVNKENGDAEDHGAECPNKPEYWASLGGRRDKPADQGDLRDDHYSEPEPEIYELLSEAIKFGHPPYINVGSVVALTTPSNDQANRRAAPARTNDGACAGPSG
jgi:hypothetical protein